MEQHDFEFVTTALYVVCTKDICIVGGGLQVLTHMNDILEDVAQRFSQQELPFNIWERDAIINDAFNDTLFLLNMN